MKAYCTKGGKCIDPATLGYIEIEGTPPRWLRLRQEARQEPLPNTLWIKYGVRILGV